MSTLNYKSNTYGQLPIGRAEKQNDSHRRRLTGAQNEQSILENTVKKIRFEHQ